MYNVQIVRPVYNSNKVTYKIYTPINRIAKDTLFCAFLSTLVLKKHFSLSFF